MSDGATLSELAVSAGFASSALDRQPDPSREAAEAMSAVNATASSAQSFDAPDEGKLAEQRAHEPSMEEILASIRRIIADDQALPLSPRPSLPFAGRDGPVSPVIFPVRPSLSPEAAEAGGNPPDGLLDGAASGKDPEDIAMLARELLAEPLPTPEEIPMIEALAARAKIEDEEGEEALADSEPELEAADLADPADEAEVDEPPRAAPAARGDRFEPILSVETSTSVASAFNTLAATMLIQNLPSVEDLARDLLRPMLKSWLDDNLPVLVERLVRAEIERVARGGR